MSHAALTISDPLVVDAGLSPDATAEVEAIRSVLSIRGRFLLASVLCDDLAVERAVIANLRRSSPGICLVEMSRGDDHDPFSLADRLAGVQPDAVFVVGLTEWLAEPERRVSRAGALNASRERWIERFRCPVLLWMNHTTAHVLAQHAPDVWRYRSHRFELEAGDAQAGHATSVTRGHYEASGGVQPLAETERDARERIEELHQRLRSLPPAVFPPLLRLSNRWRNELGLLHGRLGDLDAAERIFREALKVDGDTSDMEGQATRLGNLGGIARTRGDLDGAERLHREALEIEKKLGRLEGQANQLGNLGLIAAARGHLAEARRLWTQSRDLFARIGMPHMVEQVQSCLDGLPPE